MVCHAFSYGLIHLLYLVYFKRTEILVCVNETKERVLSSFSTLYGVQVIMAI